MRVFETMGTMGVTTRVATTDTATGISASILTSATGSRSAQAVTISIETANVRVGFNVSPTQGGSGIGHLMYPGDSWRIVGRENLEQFKYISASNGVAGAIQMTAEY